MTVALWFAVPARRQVIVRMLAMFGGATVALSGVFVSFVSTQGLSEAIGYTNDDAGGRYLLPVLLAWFSTILTMFFADPSSATTADRSLPLLKNGCWLVVGALLILALGVFVLPKNESPLPENPLPSAAATNSPNGSETNPPENPDLQTRMELASKAVELTGQQQPVCIRTLAAAYAEAGQFAKAVEMAKKARAIALLTCLVEEAAINETIVKTMLRSSDWLDEWTIAEGFRENRRPEGALTVNSNQPAYFIRICGLRLVTSNQPLAKRMTLFELRGAVAGTHAGQIRKQHASC
jgi:hypothetical protein